MQRYVIFSESAIKKLILIDSHVASLLRMTESSPKQLELTTKVSPRVIGEAAGANAKRLSIKSSKKLPGLMRKEAGEKDL